MTSFDPVNILKLLGIVVAVPVVCGVLFLAYQYLSIVTGFHEWQDAYHVRHYKLASGEALERVVQERLRSRGIHKPIVWRATCYGPSAIVTACTGESRYPWPNCLGFEFHSNDSVLTSNSLAAEIIPELEHISGPYGIELDHATLDKLR